MEQQLLDSPTMDLSKTVGLTDAEAKEHLLKFGRNYVAEKRQNLLVLLLRKFWLPIPWMLEATIILQLIIGKIEEAIIFTTLLAKPCLLKVRKAVLFIQAL